MFRSSPREQAVSTTDYEVVRLTHPVDAQRFKPLYPIHAVPRRALLLGNYLQGARLQRLARQQ